MKKWLITGMVIVVLIIGAYLILSFYAVRFIRERLQIVAGSGLKVSEISVKPTSLSFKSLRYVDPSSGKKLLEINDMRIYPDLFSLLKKEVIIRDWIVRGASLHFYRSEEGNITGPWVLTKREEQEGEKSEKERKGKIPVRIKIERFRMEEGALDFEDRGVEGNPAEIRLRKLDLNVRQVRFPTVSGPSPIELQGKIKGEKREGEIYANGWIDLKTMDVSTSLKILGMDLKTFKPYYRKKVSAEIESGYMNMDVKISVKEKRIDAPGQMELVDFKIKEDGTIFYIPARTLVSLLRDRGNRIKFQFHVVGDIGDPRFKLRENLLSRIGISLAESLGIPIKVFGERLLEGSGKGAEGLIEGLRSIEELFKKRKKK